MRKLSLKFTFSIPETQEEIDSVFPDEDAKLTLEEFEDLTPEKAKETFEENFMDDPEMRRLLKIEVL